MSKVALVVDDSMLIRFTVCRFLEERGFTVESASNGAEAVQILARIHPGLVVTDLDMPQMSGSEFITVLKAKPETALIPIIIVAGRASRAKQSENRADLSQSTKISTSNRSWKKPSPQCWARRERSRLPNKTALRNDPLASISAKPILPRRKIPTAPSPSQ